MRWIQGDEGVYLVSIGQDNRWYLVVLSQYEAEGLILKVIFWDTLKNSIYRIASISQSVTAMTVMMLVDMGLLDLDLPVNIL